MMTDHAFRGPIFTIGHSTRSATEFVELLRAHAITGVLDIRAVPRSRRHPHFSREALTRILTQEGIEYRHEPALGGKREPRVDSPNGAWRDPAMRGYADHMTTQDFSAAIESLLEFAARLRLAVMCAEAKWWECHRQLVADVLVARGIEVCHVMSARDVPPHELTSFARVIGGGVQYPSLV
jgi:uncharacterized protein (DUF488 family)